MKKEWGFQLKFHKLLSKKNHPLAIILPWLIIFLAIFLRLYKVDHFPIHNEADALVHVWTGTSLLKNIRNPISNSIFVKEHQAVLFWRSDYKFYDTVRRFRFHLIDPYLDHPFLAMIFTSLPAWLFGFTDFVQVPQILVNLPAVLISVFSLFLVFYFAKRLFSLKTAYLSLLVYGFAPIFVFSHRQPYLENFLTPLFLLIFILIHQYLKTEQKSYFLALIFSTALASWIKLPGFSIVLIACFWFLKAKKSRQAFFIFMSGLLSLSLYFLYGLWVDKNHFLHTLAIQTGRGMDPNAFIRVLTSPDFYQPFMDGFYLIGFISIFSLLFFKNKKKIDFFLINFFFLLTLLVITTTKTNNFFWYRYPLYPFLAIAAGEIINKLLKEESPLLFFLIYFLGFFAIDALAVELPTLILRIGYIIPPAFIFLSYLRPKKKTAQIGSFLAVRIMLLLLLLLNILAILRYPTVQCQNARCLMPDKIIVNQNSLTPNP